MPFKRALFVVVYTFRKDLILLKFRVFCLRILFIFGYLQGLVPNSVCSKIVNCILLCDAICFGFVKMFLYIVLIVPMCRPCYSQ